MKLENEREKEKTKCGILLGAYIVGDKQQSNNNNKNSNHMAKQGVLWLIFNAIPTTAITLQLA